MIRRVQILPRLYFITTIPRLIFSVTTIVTANYCFIVHLRIKIIQVSNLDRDERVSAKFS